MSSRLLGLTFYVWNVRGPIVGNREVALKSGRCLRAGAHVYVETLGLVAFCGDRSQALVAKRPLLHDFFGLELTGLGHDRVDTAMFPYRQCQRRNRACTIERQGCS